MPIFNQELLKKFNFIKLFNELGWDAPAQQQPYVIDIGDETWSLDVVAYKKGVQVLHCRPDSKGNLPDYSTRQKIERKVTAEVREHLIVFTDAIQSTQIWQWVSRQQGKTAQYREVNFRKGEAPELLTQKLSRLHFTLDDEELLTVLGVTQRLDDAAPREKVTKDFYKEFEKQRKSFAEFIDGIPETSEDQRWYTAVLIDRLMFLWFLQEKSFLDGKKDYLQLRLAQHLGKNIGTQPQISFYKNFLSPLFFRGFAEERTNANRAGIAAEFGDVPYLNGGLFAPHQLEQRYGDALDVADIAFSKLFAFFDQWEWHLDERPLKSGREINPDVLGYIFEKFVNQKQMGAYYTKEDITDYIGKNTIIPCLLAKVRADHPKAFDELAWPLLQQSGDTYIYPAMLKGVDDVYPDEISDGLDTAVPDLLSRRKPWNKRAADAVSLPTEIWRETIARHQRTREIRAKLAAGELNEVADLITYNLDIRQFAQDLIERCTDVALLKSFWFALAGRLPRKSNEKFRHGLSVLDPTCGSGAFLFAALNILKPLYDATLRTLQAVRSDTLITGDKNHPDKWAEVDELLARFGAASSERAQDYAVIKHIIVNNLYGVDIEEQATEIAKLRLFLKLVALLEPGDDIEPLPDIDFNIRHGNTLVGYATADETEKAVKGATQGNLFSDAWEDIRIRLVAVEQQYNNFQIQQVQRGGHVAPEDKQALIERLSELEEMLNYHLAREYGVNTVKSADYEKWKISHQPFHWYVDFYPLMASGGFDAVIGNPPYVELGEISEYRLKGYSTIDAGNLYALTYERSLLLVNRTGYVGEIIPVSCLSTPRYSSLAQLVRERGLVVASHFNDRPAKLFDGLEHIRLSILLSVPRKDRAIYSSNFRRWLTEERAVLMDTLCFTETSSLSTDGSEAKVGSLIGAGILKQLASFKRPFAAEYQKNGAHQIFYTRKLSHFLQVLDQPPSIIGSDGLARDASELKSLSFPSEIAASFGLGLLNSSLFYWFFTAFSDCRNVNRREIDFFPSCFATANNPDKKQIGLLAKKLMESMRDNAKFVTMNYIKHGRMTIQCFFPRLSKTEIDALDVVLGRVYGLTIEQLDFIINYDIKYRIGEGGQDD